MDCINHPAVEAVGRCTGCAEPHCHNCLVDVAGIKYCANCKQMAVTTRPVVEQNIELCGEAKTALIMAGVAVIACLFIPILALGCALGSVYNGWLARKKIAEDASLSGSGIAAAAMVIGSSELLMGVLIFMKMQH